MSRARDLADSADKDLVGTLTVDGLSVDGDVGIGTSSPSNFSGYTTLDVVNATNGGAILARGSTVEARFVADDPTGTVQVKAQSNHPLMFATSGTERMRIDSSGSIGIGTTSQLLAGSAVNIIAGSDYAPAITIGSSASAANWARLDFKNTNATGTGIIYQDQSGNFVIRNDGANPITFLTNGGNERIRIDSSGNVGIGRPTPVNFGANWTSLEVAGKSTTTGGVVRVATSDASVQGDFYVDSSQLTIRTATNHPLVLATNVTERMRIDSSGNVGIGTASPSTKLSVVSSTNAGISVNDGTVNTILYNTSSANATIGTTTNHPIAVYTNNAERMRIDSSGNVGIGTSSPSERVTIGANSVDTALSGTSNSQGLHMYQRAYGIAQIDSLVSGTSNSGMSLRTYNNGVYTPFIQNIQGNTTTFATAGTERMRIDSSGAVNIGAAASVTGLRYFDIYNTGSTSTDGSIIRFITQQVGNTSTTSADIYKRKNGEFTFANNDADSAAHTRFTLAGSEKMRIDSSGRVGIGTSLPAANLTVYENITSVPNYWDGLQVEIKATTGTAGIGLHRAGYSHVGIYHDTVNRLSFSMSSGTAHLDYNAGTLYGTGNSHPSKQWCRWNQTGTAAINDSFNTSSLTDNGTGRGQLAYTSNMSDGNYSIATGVGELTGGGNRGIGVRGVDKPPSTDGCAYFCFNTNWSGADQDLCSTSIFGDLA